MLRAFTLAYTLAFFTPAAQAQESIFQLPAKPAARINDYAHVISPQALSRLEDRYAKFEAATGHQAFVAIFPDIGGQPVENVATKLLELWGVGDAKKHDGILLVLGIKEHAVRIEVGYGLEDRIPDARASRIIREELFPHLKNTQYATAVFVFVRRLEEIFSTRPQGELPRYDIPNFKISPFWIILLIAIIVLLRSRSRYSRTIDANGVRTRHISWGGGGFSSGGGFGGFGGGFGGFGGGGGGLSGGGGASGSW